MLAELARTILAVDRRHPVRVAIDGCSAAGKTTLADELAEVLRHRTERAVIRVQIDHFKRAVESRTAYPADSPESYYLDSWDNEAIRDRLLRPLGPGGSLRYRTAVMDLPGRVAVDAPVQMAPDDAVLLADGAFLQRPELDPYWDLRIYVDVGFDEVLRRGIARDQRWSGRDPGVGADVTRAWCRHIPAGVPYRGTHTSSESTPTTASPSTDGRRPRTTHHDLGAHTHCDVTTPQPA